MGGFLESLFSQEETWLVPPPRSAEGLRVRYVTVNEMQLFESANLL